MCQVVALSPSRVNLVIELPDQLGDLELSQRPGLSLSRVVAEVENKGDTVCLDEKTDQLTLRL